jgi:hypothetical protein
MCLVLFYYLLGEFFFLSILLYSLVPILKKFKYKILKQLDFNMKNIFLLTLFVLLLSCSHKSIKSFPKHWWTPVDKSELQWWEVGPSAAKDGEVVLSKRNELGILSNFADTPFEFRGKQYTTVEGLWQSMKYPESSDDVRNSIGKLEHTRYEVSQMQGFPAKRAGDAGSKIMKLLNIDWVSFEGKEFIYRTSKKGEHYKIIRSAMMEKLKQNPKVKEILMSTGDLILIADHHTNKSDPPAWKYYQIWMEIRGSLRN